MNRQPVGSRAKPTQAANRKAPVFRRKRALIHASRRVCQLASSCAVFALSFVVRLFSSPTVRVCARQEREKRQATAPWPR
jgi:hypothetical protein